jgi:hypothetical protein
MKKVTFIYVQIIAENNLKVEEEMSRDTHSFINFDFSQNLFHIFSRKYVLFLWKYALQIWFRKLLLQQEQNKNIMRTCNCCFSRFFCYALAHDYRNFVNSMLINYHCAEASTAHAMFTFVFASRSGLMDIKSTSTTSWCRFALSEHCCWGRNRENDGEICNGNR